MTQQITSLTHPIGCDKMALELNYEHDLGFTMNGIYAKIERLSLENKNNDENISVNYTVKFYKNETARQEGEHPFGGKSFTMPLNVSNGKTQYNLIKQCYLHLKEQEGFTNSIDS